MLGILGGTFDPVHFGHLRPALDVAEKLKLDEVRLIPCGQPPHRQQPVATPLQRLAMLRAAIEHYPEFKVDDRELCRAGPSYMVDTLMSLKNDFPDQALCLILGWDAFVGLGSWYQWTHLFELAHIVVTQRPGWSMEQIDSNSELAEQLNHRLIEAEDLGNDDVGKIILMPVVQLDISSTHIREQLQKGESVSDLLPEQVEEFIVNQNIYG